MDLVLAGRVAETATVCHCRSDVCSLLLTAVRALRRPLYPLTWCSGSRPRRRQQDSFFCELRYAAAVMQLEDRSEERRVGRGGGARGTGSMLERRGVSDSG